MKKVSKSFAIVLTLMLSLALVSCNKKDEPSIPGFASAKYLVKIDNKEVAKGKGYAKRDTSDESYGNNNIVVIKNTTEEFSEGVSITGIPTKVGASAEIDGDAIGVVVMGLTISGTANRALYTLSGTLKRESANKVSFNGSCFDSKTEKKYILSGYVESSEIGEIK